MSDTQRVVISGLGLLCSLGESPEKIRAAVSGDQPTYSRPDFAPAVVGCPVEGFDLLAYTGRWKHRRYLSRGAALGLAAACQALESSGFPLAGRDEMGLFTGVGPNLDVSKTFRTIESGSIDPSGVEALWLLHYLPNTLAGSIAQRLGVRGENMTLATACTASLQAAGEAFYKIRHGVLQSALVAGGDSRLNPGGILGYQRADALYCGDGPANQACCPFDIHRQGFICGEGGAAMVLESLEHARQRGATLVGEIRGYACTMDGLAMTAPDPQGQRAEVAVRRALEMAGNPPIDLICAHGTGTVLNDAMEAELIVRIFGESTPPVAALKSWIGHTSAASGICELTLALTCLQGGTVPPIRNLQEPCHGQVNFLRRALHDPVEHVLVQNFGFGGQNAAMVVRLWRS